MKKLPIGIFDSGLGGLTVQREIALALPYEDTIYLGDTAHVPYGTKSVQTVTRYSKRIAEFLSEKGIKLLVVACNTASAYALDELRKTLDIPVIGVIDPGAQMAVASTKTMRVGVIGTEGTVRSGAYFDAIKAHNVKVSVFFKACPLFVPLAEEGMLDNKIAALTASHYLGYFKEHPVDTVVLGCTHYPLLKEAITKALGRNVTLIDSAEATAIEVRELLSKEELLRTEVEKEGDSDRIGSHKFYVTDSPERFIQVGRHFLGDTLAEAELVDLGG